MSVPSWTLIRLGDPSAPSLLGMVMVSIPFLTEALALSISSPSGMGGSCARRLPARFRARSSDRRLYRAPPEARTMAPRLSAAPASLGSLGTEIEAWTRSASRTSHERKRYLRLTISRRAASYTDGGQLSRELFWRRAEVLAGGLVGAVRRRRGFHGGVCRAALRHVHHGGPKQPVVMEVAGLKNLSHGSRWRIAALHLRDGGVQVRIERLAQWRNTLDSMLLHGRKERALGRPEPLRNLLHGLARSFASGCRVEGKLQIIERREQVCGESGSGESYCGFSVALAALATVFLIGKSAQEL